SHLGLRDVQQLGAIHYDPVCRLEITQLARLLGRLSDRREGDVLEALPQERKRVATLGFQRAAQREFLAAAAGRKQAYAGFNQADIALEWRHGASPAPDELATATQG